MTTAVPGMTLTDLGWVIPEESAILAGALTDLNAAFGGNLNIASLETPQGQLASSTAAIVGEANDEKLLLFNSFDPAYASGRAQDALGRIYFLERDPARPTSVNATCTGLPGVVITVGALAVSTDGNLYRCAQATTIPGGGSVVVPFECSETGPIACPPGALSRIYQAIPGWDSVTNISAGSLGNDVESREAFETRREESVALNARGILPSIQAAVLALPNVLDAYTTENETSIAKLINGFNLRKNSLYVAVSGGDSQAIGEAIWRKKAPGCNYNGNTAVTVTDSNSGYVIPLPTYTVTFERPTDTPVKFAVVLKAGSAVPADYVAQVRAAVQSAFAGLDGGPRARIGSQLFALRYFSPIAALGAWAQVITIKLGVSSATLDTVLIQIDQRPVLSDSDIAVSTV